MGKREEGRAKHQPIMATINSYRDLKVWQAGRELVLQIYRATKDFPSEERFGLTSQMRRAAVSIPSNNHAREFKTK